MSQNSDQLLAPSKHKETAGHTARGKSKAHSIQEGGNQRKVEGGNSEGQKGYKTEKCCHTELLQGGEMGGALRDY